MYNTHAIDTVLRSFVEHTVPGCACVVTHKNEIVYEGYHGLADVQAGIPVGQETVYRLFSMTKVAIYTACMILFEQGKFLLDDPLYEFFPEYRQMNKCVMTEDGPRIVPAKQPILIRHIMSMTCGLPYGVLHNEPGEESITQREMNSVYRKLHDEKSFTLREQIRAVAEVPLAFEPGTRWMYGFGSELAAGLLEILTGLYIEDALKEILFDPLDMKNTCMHYFGSIQQRLSPTYLRDKQGRIQQVAQIATDLSNMPDKRNICGCPRLLTTAKDFSALSQMLACGGIFHGKRIMGRKTIDLMRANQLNELQLSDFAHGPVTGYGYGLGVRTLINPVAANSNSSVGEFGWVGGSGTWVAIDPSEQFSVVYMHQMLPCMEEYHHLRVRAAAFAGL